MPTFGKTTVGASAYNTVANRLFGCLFALSESGQVTSISLYRTDPSSGNSKCLIYNSANQKLGETQALTHAGGATGWKTYTFASPLSLSPGSYYLCFNSDTPFWIWYDSGESGQWRDQDATYCSEPSTASWTGSQARAISIYATYEAGATYVDVSDSGVGSDVLGALQASISVSETGSGAESSGLEAQLSLSNSGAGVDATLLEASLSLADTGLGVDSVEVFIGQLISVFDSGVGSDIIQLEAQIPISDLGTGTDLLSALQALLTVLESGTGLESVTAGPPTAIKTKIFLIFGGLAIQLTGD